MQTSPLDRCASMKPPDVGVKQLYKMYTHM